MSAYLDQIREFVGTHVMGKEAYLDSFPAPPFEAYTAFQNLGLANWWIPKEYGGRGISLEQSVEVVSELAYGDAGLAFAFLVPIIGSSMIRLFGSASLRQRYLRDMAEKGTFLATLASEQGAGGELMRTETTALKDGSRYLISGRKMYSTNAGFAPHWVVVVRAPEHDSGFLAVALPRESEGIQVQRRWPMIGLRSSGTYEVTFSNCPVPLDAALTGNGLRLLEVGLNASRLLIASTAIGIARRVRDLCLAYATSKQLKGAPLLQNAVFAAKLGQVEAEIEAMSALCTGAARRYDELMASDDPSAAFTRAGTLKGVLSAKMICGQLGWRIASLGSEMFGGLGYTEETLIGKLVRDVRYISIVEGGDDALRDILYARFVIPQWTASARKPIPPAKS